MHFAASIYDAIRRLEEAAAIFRMKSRSALEEYAELGAHWNDARARRFSLQHLEPQREWMERGAQLCQAHSGFADAARNSAEQAEREITSFFAAQSAFESASESARAAARAARDEADGSRADSSRVSAEVQSIAAGIAGAAIDPGW